MRSDGSDKTIVTVDGKPAQHKLGSGKFRNREHWAATSDQEPEVSRNPDVLGGNKRKHW